jgi:hypothetical protein
MIRINITTEQGELLGSTTLDTDDLNQNGRLRAEWAGEKILDQLPSHPDALRELLTKE